MNMTLVSLSDILEILDVSGWSKLNQGNSQNVYKNFLMESLSLFRHVKYCESFLKGGFIVVTDMILSVVSIFLNLMVMMAIKEEEELSSRRFSLVLTNLCSSNVLNSSLVKSLAIVHNSYMVAAGVTRSEVPLCLVYVLSWRVTWATLPWTIVLGCWLTTLQSIKVANTRPTDGDPPRFNVR